jgi:hypothetical protein
MDALGPNPEVMFGSLVDSMKRQIGENPKLSDAQKAKQKKSLSFDGGSIRQAMDIATGLVSRPVNVTGAKISADIRATQSMAKLGGALFSSIFSDTVTAGAAAQFRGSGFLKGFFAQLNGFRRGRPKGELAEISFLTGEGFDGIIGHIVAPAAAVDGPVGHVAGLQERFFRWNGLSWWTDIQRATAGRVIAAEMGMRAKTAYASLPANYRHVLGLHSIDEAKWNVIRKIEARQIEGKSYITPDRIRELPDEMVAGLGRDAADGRRKLELSVLRFFADETSYGIVETDARSRRTTTLGYRPGTTGGEAIRFAMQFKGFPVAFTQRVGGRALFGHRAGAGMLERSAHIGTLVAGLTMAGYAAMTFKDMAKGYWPPRDPFEHPLEVFTAAFLQGGAAGIYGDFLFGRVSRFGGDTLETISGPTIGTGSQLWDLARRAMSAGLSEEEEFKFGELVTMVSGNTPYANLFYVKPALDFLFMNSLREALSPGYLRRNEGRRKKEYGQISVFPAPLTPFN